MTRQERAIDTPVLAGSGFPAFRAGKDRPRDPGLWAMYLYFLVASGAFFPLRFIPVNYEWITLATTVAVLGYQLRRFGPGRLREYTALYGIIAAVILYQSVKALASPDQINLVQFFRGVYGLMVLVLAAAIPATSPVSRDGIFRISSNVLLLLTVLVVLSVLTGLRLYATGFITEERDEDITSVISGGRYRIITYYSTFVIFLFFSNLILFFNGRKLYHAAVALCCLVLIILTGTRSLIAPTLVMMIPIALRYARPGAILTFAVCVVALAGIVYAAIPDLVGAYLSRFYVEQAFDSWRAIEQELTLQAIGTAPIFGLPLGVPYSNVMSALSGGTEGYALNADYDLHNEYLWLQLYFGAVGCMALAALVGVIVRRVIASTRGTAFLPAFLCYLLVMLASMNYSGILLKGYGALLFGLVIGVCTARSSTRPSVAVSKTTTGVRLDARPSATLADAPWFEGVQGR